MTKADELIQAVKIVTHKSVERWCRVNEYYILDRYYRTVVYVGFDGPPFLRYNSLTEEFDEVDINTMPELKGAEWHEVFDD